jgi:hypothetical protein
MGNWGVHAKGLYYCYYYFVLSLKLLARFDLNAQISGCDCHLVFSCARFHAACYLFVPGFNKFWFSFRIQFVCCCDAHVIDSVYLEPTQLTRKL